MNLFLHNLSTGLQLGLHMAWETWWALVLGFTIAGAVESFVSEERMTEALGGRGFREIALGTVFGAASSSCSFGAVATTKSLFKKGASAVASLAAFQFASTNLVIELGLVMWVLLGWEFVAANVVAGLLLISLVAAAYEFVVPDRWIEHARQHVRSQEGVRDPVCGMEVDPTDPDAIKLETEGGVHYFCSEHCKQSFVEQDEQLSWSDRLFTARGWREAAQNAMGEWQMLWSDIVVGFLIAGLIAGFVPRDWWTAMFNLGVEGSFVSLLLSCTIAVAVGVITFVCSVGNVPFALVLWNNGIPFGGVMSFIFADLIIPPLDNAYRRYYGLRMAATMFGAIFVAAAISGVAIHYVWHAFGLVPPSGELGGTAPEGYTLYLNAVFTVVFLAQLAATYLTGPEDREANGTEDDH
ncbi:MAG: permease [Bradymonadaceae bacterium]